MKKFEILEHRADLKIKIFGKTKEELFLNALLAMEEFLQPKKKEKETEREIKIASLDFSSLLVDFLSEALYLIQTNKEVYNKIEFKKFSNTEIEAKIFGQKVESFAEDIKGVTYHDLKIKKETKGWEAIVLFDI